MLIQERVRKHMRLGALVGFMTALPFIGIWLEQPIEDRLKSGNRNNIVHILQDGTVATLSANSVITFGEQFKQHRTLRLWGQAAFTLHAGAGEFVVRTRHADVVAIDADFKVSARPEEPSTITVTRGSVKVRDLTTDGYPPPVTILSAGQSHTVNGTPTEVKSPYSVKAAVAWAKRTLSEGWR